MQIRFEDAASAVTVYGLWDDDETPALVTILASLPDAFRAREGAPLVHAGWARALEACASAEADRPGAPLAERHAAARTAFLAGGPVAGDAASVAALLLAYDAHYFRPYPDSGPSKDDDHGLDGHPHITVSVDVDDFGQGPETTLRIQVAPSEWLSEMFRKPLDPDGDLGDQWVRQADLALARRIRALSPFGTGMIRVEQGREGAPTVLARLDAATVATAHARLLGMPLPANLELHGGVPAAPASPDAPALPVGPGRLHVRFSRPAGPRFGMEATTVTLARSGDARDIPDVLARVAALPLLPVALEATQDRLGMILAKGETFAARQEPSAPDDFLRHAPHPDVAVRMRETGRSLYPHGGPNMRGSVQGYASLLFAAEPGLWRVLPGDEAAAADPDVTVTLDRVLPPNMAGGFVFRSSAEPAPAPDDPPMACISHLMTAAPAPRHLAACRADPSLGRHAETFDAWGEALAPLRTEWVRFDPSACSFTANFEACCLAAAYARYAGIEVPPETPYGPLPPVGPYRWRLLGMRAPGWEDEALLGPAEIDMQRRAQAELAERRAR